MCEDVIPHRHDYFGYCNECCRGIAIGPYNPQNSKISFSEKLTSCFQFTKGGINFFHNGITKYTK